MDLHEEWEYVLPSSARISDAGKLPRDLIVPIVADYAGQQRQMHETIVMNIHSVNYMRILFLTFRTCPRNNGRNYENRFNSVYVLASSSCWVGKVSFLSNCGFIY